jgi:hypothetical protein
MLFWVNDLHFFWHLYLLMISILTIGMAAGPQSEPNRPGHGLFGSVLLLGILK